MCNRCGWAQHSELEIQYHDQEWGQPQKNDQVLFEFLILEAAQAGLSWRTVLEKREGYHHHYEGFDPVKVAAFDQDKIEQMLQDPGIIRNRRKVESSVENARVFLEIQQEFGSFARFVWSFVDHQPIQNQWTAYADAPAETDESKALSKALKKRGMRFVGPTICYAFMQAMGLVNDHEVTCPQYRVCQDLAKDWSPA